MSTPRDKYASPFDRVGKYIGIAMTVVAHALLLFVGITAGLKEVYPPPQEKGILIEFEQTPEPTPIVTAVGVEPRAEIVEPEKEVTLVQRAEAPVKDVEAVNRGTETTVGTEGDVEVPEPPAKKEINRRALFSSSMNRRDTIAPQAAAEATDELTAGHPQGNTAVGNPEGTPTARLKGRTVMGNLPLPSYSVQNAGTVVVRILVDQYGKVIEAHPGAKGTTVNDATLWEAAKKAALEAKFNLDANAPSVQEGTISYVFKLR